MMNLLNYRCLLRLVFTYLHSDIICSHNHKFESSDVDLFFTQQVIKTIHPNLLRPYVVYKLPDKYYEMEVLIENPMIENNSYLPGKMYRRNQMFSDIIPLVIQLLTSQALKKMNTYRKILLRRFMTLQESSFNYWNQFFDIINKPVLLNEFNYRIRNQIDQYFVRRFIVGLQNSSKLSFYLNYTVNGRRIATLF